MAMKNLGVIIVLVLHVMGGVLSAQPVRWEVRTGQIEFVSEAPLEIIKASSGALKGLLEADSRRFAFSVPMSSFEGFNSPLQREHFQENYLEIGAHPDATFTGKIIEPVDLTEPGITTIRAKGIFTIHGVEQERIIRVNLEHSDGQLFATCSFSVLLSEHQIRIPRIVNQKIAETIQVDLRASFEIQEE